MAEDPQATRNKGGRPRRVADPMTVSAWVEKKEYDRLYALAKAREVSISSVVRAVLTRGLRRS